MTAEPSNDPASVKVMRLRYGDLATNAAPTWTLGSGALSASTPRSRKPLTPDGGVAYMR